MKRIMFISVCFIFLSGCSLLKKEIVITHDIEFIKDTNVDYDNNIDSSQFIVSVDGIEVNSSNVQEDRLYVSNFEVKCPTVKMKLGKQLLKYTIGQEEYDLEINIVDRVKPTIVLKKDNFEIEEGKELSLIQNTDFSVQDNCTEEQKIKVTVIKKKENLYQITATDESHNTSTKDINVTIKKKSIVSEKDNQSNKNQSSNSSQPSSKPSGSTSSESNQSSPANSFNKFFEGNSIDTYNKACDYAERTMNAHHLGGYEVKPTGTGFQVNFYK